jgi:hypothetical protein
VGNGVNTSGSEYDPSLGANTDTLYFASTRSGGFGGYDIWVSIKSGGNWAAANNMGGIINSASNERGPAYQISGSYAYMYYQSDRAGGQGGNDIWRATYFSGVWSGPAVQTPLNSTSEDIQPYIADNPVRCFFASNRGGGFGGYDLWYSSWVGSVWTTPVNVGSGVNTVYDEIGPSVNAGNDVLYFYSNRIGGPGGYDLYRALAGGGIWGSTEVLGSPPNTGSFEGTPGRSADGSLFFASDRSGGYGSNDIWVTVSPDAVAPASMGKVKALFK